MFSRINHRTLAGGSLAVSVAAYASERTTSRASLRVASKSSEYAIQQLQQRASFSSSSSSSEAGGGLLAKYEKSLEARPVLTKAVTGACLWSIGDAVAQLVPQAAGQAPPAPYDFARTGRACLFGFAIHAPTSHVHYNFLEWMTVKAGFTGLKIPLFKAFMEQFVYWSWISNSIYHGAMSLMQGFSPSEAVDRIKDVLWETQKAQWVFWIPVQLLNFNYVPVRHQLNVVLLTSIVWTALLSAWYPPQTDEIKKEALEAAEHD